MKLIPFILVYPWECMVRQVTALSLTHTHGSRAHMSDDSMIFSIPLTAHGCAPSALPVLATPVYAAPPCYVQGLPPPVMGVCVASPSGPPVFKGTPMFKMAADSPSTPLMTIEYVEGFNLLPVEESPKSPTKEFLTPLVDAEVVQAATLLCMIRHSRLRKKRSIIRCGQCNECRFKCYVCKNCMIPRRHKACENRDPCACIK